MLSNAFALNANGGSFYSAAGTLVGDKLPQEAIWGEYASMYRFYLIESIELEFYPTR
jgi:hypothetical protein